MDTYNQVVYGLDVYLRTNTKKTHVEKKMDYVLQIC